MTVVMNKAPNALNMIFDSLRERKAQRQGERLQEQAIHKLVESQFGQCMAPLKAVKTQRNHHAKIGISGIELAYLPGSSVPRFMISI